MSKYNTQGSFFFLIFLLVVVADVGYMQGQVIHQKTLRYHFAVTVFLVISWTSSHS